MDVTKFSEAITFFYNPYVSPEENGINNKGNIFYISSHTLENSCTLGQEEEKKKSGAG